MKVRILTSRGTCAKGSVVEADLSPGRSWCVYIDNDQICTLDYTEFEIIPDPAPAQSDWMAIGGGVYIGKKVLRFTEQGLDSQHQVDIHDDIFGYLTNVAITCVGSYADAWAQLVGHKWEVQS